MHRAGKTKTQVFTTESKSTTPEENKYIIRKAVLRASKILKVNQKELSEILGFSESKASRLFNVNSDTYIEPNTKEWDLAVLFLRMFRSLDSLFGGQESEYILWFNSYNQHLQGRPCELVKKIEGIVEVVHYLDAYRGLA